MLRLIFSLVLLFWMSVLKAEDLRQVYVMALNEDPELRAAYFTMKADKTVLPQAISQMLPSLTATYTTESATNNPPFTSAFSTRTYGLTLNQPIFHPEQWAQVEQSRHISKRAFATYMSVVQELIVRVSTRYFDVLRAIDNLEFSVQQRKGFARQLEQSEQRFEVGLIAITDVQEAKARYDNAVALEIEAQNAVFDQYELLREITKCPVNEVVLFQTTKPLPLKLPCPNSPEEWVNMAQIHNFSIVAAKENAQTQKAVIGTQASGHFPKIDLTGSVSRAKNPPPFDDVFSSRNLGVNINFPLFQSGNVLFRTQEARYRYDEAMQQLEKTRRSVYSNTRQSFRGVQTAISSIKALAQAVVSNETALEATEAAYEVGTRTIVDVLNAQTNLLNAQREYASARYDYLLEGLLLKQASGCLTADDLYAINDIVLGRASMENMTKEELEASKVKLNKD